MCQRAEMLTRLHHGNKNKDSPDHHIGMYIYLKQEKAAHKYGRTEEF